MTVKIYHEDGTVEELVPKLEQENPPVEKPKVIVHWDPEETQDPVSQQLPIPERPEPAHADREKYDQIIVKMGEVHRHKQRICNHLVDVHETAGLERRSAIVNEIKELRGQYNELHYQKDYYERHGVFPIQKDDKPKLTDLQKHELLRRRGNVSANISKAKNMVRKYQHNPDKLVQYQAKQVSLQAELEEIDGLLGR